MSTPPNLLTLPLEIRENIWSHLLDSIVEDTKTVDKKYLLCTDKPRLCWHQVANFRYHSQSAHRRAKYTDRTGGGRYYEAAKEAGRLLKSTSRSPRSKNPLVAYLLVSKQIKLEIEFSATRSFAAGDRIVVLCCCSRAAERVNMTSPMNLGKRIRDA